MYVAITSSPLFYQPLRDQEFKAYLQFIPSKSTEHFHLLAQGHTIHTNCQLRGYLFALISKKRCAYGKLRLQSLLHKDSWERQGTWLLFSAWLFLLESGKWMWHPVSSITFLMLLPPLPITWECSVCETSIFRVTRLLYVQTTYYFLMHEKGTTPQNIPTQRDNSNKKWAMAEHTDFLTRLSSSINVYFLSIPLWL